MRLHYSDEHWMAARGARQKIEEKSLIPVAPSLRPRRVMEVVASTCQRSSLPALLVLLVASAQAEDWPTRMHDTQRSGVSQMKLSVPLVQKWRVATPKPMKAWTEAPAQHDYAHNYRDLKQRQNFDSCSDVVIAGSLVYFGSSVDGTVTCVDNATGGREVWRYATDGPVRFAPHVAEGRVYFGSDDGCAYCLNATDGSLIWRTRAGPTDEMVWGNGHMISVWPVRTSVLVEDGEVYWTAGLFPEEGMYLCKRKASDGSGGWTVKPQVPPQGYLLVTADRLFVPTGKTQPRVYSRKDGSLLGQIGGERQGGSWALITPDKKVFWSGPGVHGALHSHSSNTAKRVASIRGATRVVVTGDEVYYNTPSEIVKMNRRDGKDVWRKKQAYPYVLIVVGGTVFAGGDGRVAAFDGEGNKRWAGKVDGKVYGLAAADRCLYVSTDTGSIYSFCEQTNAK